MIEREDRTMQMCPNFVLNMIEKGCQTKGLLLSVPLKLINGRELII
jgi:hypothetical protein